MENILDLEAIWERFGEDLDMIWVWSCTLFVILWMQFDTLAGFLMCLLSFQNSILTWLQRRIAVAFLNVLDVVKTAP